ncbi:MAG: type 1 glutamine amidotransferase [Thermodesulfovibrionales bacterium]|nr:type 1 glutamine amidotransferase [Thermodesulfovibrionales bacterium]
MAVLILKNIKTEGPGTIGDFLRENSVPFKVVELWDGKPVPELDKFDAVVMLGGPMGVYEMDRHPHLAVGSRLLREALNRQMRVLGICLGAQLLAHCLGAEVYKGHAEETGWLDIELTAEGIKDPLMRRLAVHPRVGDFWKRFKVLHWHGDTFDLPMGAARLAVSSLYPNQAFNCGKYVYGFQFHMEVTKEMLREWFRNGPDYERVMKDTDRLYEEYSGRAVNFYKAFFL